MQTSDLPVLVLLESSSITPSLVTGTFTVMAINLDLSLRVREQMLKLLKTQYSSLMLPAQLANIKQVFTLGNLICKTTGIGSVPKYGFFPISGYNNLVNCRQQPDLDYNLWRSGY